MTLNVCRTCMIQEKSIPFKPLFVGSAKFSKYGTYLEWIADLKVFPIEGIPTLICAKCIMSLEEAVKFRNLVQKANDKYQALLEMHQNPHQQIEVITCDKEISSMVFKQEHEELNDPEIQQEFDDVKNEPVENFQETDIQQFLAPKFQPSVSTASKRPSQESLSIQTLFSDKNQSNAPIRKNFICNQCNAIFPDDLKKQDHIIAVHKTSRKQVHKTLGCAQCSEKFFNDFERQDHVLQFHGKKSRKESHKNFFCIQCDEKFCSDFERLEHIDKVHKKTRKRLHRKPTPQGFSSPQTEYVCAYCGLYFINKFDCYVHRRRLHEEEESTLQCPHCNKSYPTLTLLRSHIKTIHAERQFMCSKCGRTFANKSFYDLHIKKENNQKDYVCEVCSSTFYTKAQLNMHMRIHSNSKPWICDCCGMRFKVKSSIVKHIKVIHLKLKPFVCEFCGRLFSIRHHLKGHMSRVHLLAESQNQ